MEEERREIRLEALAAMISFEGSCRTPCIMYSYGINGIRMGELGSMGPGHWDWVNGTGKTPGVCTG